MTSNTCSRCGAKTPPHDVVSVMSPDGTFRLLCSRCFNAEMAQRANVRLLDHPEFTPVRLPDADGILREFRFRSLLLGDRLSLEAFELTGNDDDSAGYRFQLLGEPQVEPFALLAALVQKVRRGLSVKHLAEHTGHLEVAATAVRGRIEWDGNEHGGLPCVVIDGWRIEWTDFGSILMAFEGWQFRLDLVDPGDEA